MVITFQHYYIDRKKQKQSVVTKWNLPALVLLLID